MPGMENLAPLRTLTSSGLPASPCFWPCNSSSRVSICRVCSSTSGETLRPRRKYSRHASVERVKPGGTGRPAFVISARPAPLPPSSSFILPFPSALPLPKKYAYFAMRSLRVTPSRISARRASRSGAGNDDEGEIGEAREFVAGPGEQRQAIGAQVRIGVVHAHGVEKFLEQRPQRGDGRQLLAVGGGAGGGGARGDEVAHGIGQRLFGGGEETIVAHGAGPPLLRAAFLAHDIADALERAGHAGEQKAARS